MKPIIKLMCAALLAFLPASLVLANNDHHAAVAASPIDADASTTEGEVKKVDRDTGKVTIKHGPLTNLDMPPMTMVFRVKDPAMLEQVKAGDKISFVAEKVGGQMTVTRLEVRK
jgi:Cu/Ag efflux protein CusF